MNWFKKLKTWKKIGIIGIIAIAIIAGTGNGGDTSSSSPKKSSKSYESAFDSKCRKCDSGYDFAEGYVIDGGQIYQSKQFSGNGGPFCSYDCAFITKTSRGY